MTQSTIERRHRSRSPEPLQVGKTVPNKPSAADATFRIDDESLEESPLRLPASWHQQSDMRDAYTIADDIRAGAIGFTLGLLIVLPAVLVATGRFGPAMDGLAALVQGRLGQDAAIVVVAAVSTPVIPNAPVAGTDTGMEPGNDRATGQFATADAEFALPFSSDIGSKEAADLKPADGGAAVAPDAGGEETASVDQDDALENSSPPDPFEAVTIDPDEISAQAKELIAAGEVESARRVLATARASGNPAVLFALAETYDPNVLKTYSGVNVRPDIDKARGLYLLAKLAGVREAQQRLAALEFSQ